MNPGFIPPDAAHAHTKVQKLRYMTDPLPGDVVMAGPSSLKLYSSY